MCNSLLTDEQLTRILTIVQSEPGPEIPVYKKGNTFLVDVEVRDDEEIASPKDQGKHVKFEGDGFETPKKTCRVKATPMEVDNVVEDTQWKEFWECEPCGTAFQRPA